MSTATKTKKPVRRPAARKARGYRRVKEPDTGLVITAAPAGSPKVTTEQIKALLADFP